MNTENHGGQVMQKSIQVQTNDMKRANFKLEVEGEVEKFATIVPSKVILAGTAGTPIIASVSIFQEEKHPFKIKNVRAKEGKYIQWEIKEEGADTLGSKVKRLFKGISKKGKEEIAKKPSYLLNVTNIKKEAGSYFDTLLITTDNQDRPEIKLFVSGKIDDPSAPKNDPGQPSRQQKNDNG